MKLGTRALVVNQTLTLVLIFVHGKYKYVLRISERISVCAFVRCGSAFLSEGRQKNHVDVIPSELMMTLQWYGYVK